jgi:2,3,4,5-tetrahydropyridine-2-carboxylate N-succinyltransferase
MNAPEFARIIEAAWEERANLTPTHTGSIRVAVEAALEGLDRGEYRVAEKIDGRWVVNQWLKKAVLLSFRLTESAPMGGGYDKVPLKWAGRFPALWCVSPPISRRASC